ncbi:toll/interleukin-1 receptor domain-containing protein [Daejeonella lutea]|uniref:TIR domain-containing protein n=1 Tax=Daejeonella lutea TaxID=572036 RepID=A0A1T5CXE7_9SPHI|nr:toll/interleukin-1 receptor domain-containing protein [Daejeonella lutea]SKB64006.1 TIR domain-containing protein [Daejeonella lutea]
MSIQSITSSISSVDREIHSLETQVQSVNSTISRKEKEANSYLDKIHREKDLKRIITYQKELGRKQDEINRLNKDRANKIKTLSDKQTKRLTLIQSLNKEEQRERDKIKREQKDILSVQQSITREMERQKALSSASLQLPYSTSAVQVSKSYDVFVSHASEDKDDFVRPFVELLQKMQVAVWYDEFELQIGDSLRRSIENGLKNSTYGIVVLSEAFFKKEWPQRELDGLFAKEIEGEKVILPIWHKISKSEVIKFSPIIADLMAINTTMFTIEEVAAQIAKRVKQ